MHTNMINYGIFVKKKAFNGKITLAMIHLLVSERAGLLEQKIEPQICATKALISAEAKKLPIKDVSNYLNDIQV